jgi:Flp pilus assembly protein TadB
MPNRILIVFLSFLIFSSCHKKMGGFQASSREKFTQTKMPIPSINAFDDMNVTEQKSEVVFDEIETTQLSASSEEVQISFIDANKKTEIIDFKNLKNTEKSKASILEKKPNFQKEKPSKKKKKRKKRNSVFNDGVKIGIVFLVIAILLSFLHITQLVILFGLVSVIFLYLGLKKYMRRNRLKNIFK